MAQEPPGAGGDLTAGPTGADAAPGASGAGEDLVEGAQALAALLAAPASGDGPLDAVTAALRVSRLADTALRLAVDTARGAGHSWQQISDILGTTRQAAFQRFGHPIDPRTGTEMPRDTLPGAADRAIELFTEWSQGRWAEVRRDFDTVMADKLTTGGVAAAWAQVAGMVGAYERMGEPFARRQGDYTVVDVPLEFEAGPMKGRVAFDAQGQVSGLFVLLPDTP